MAVSSSMEIKLPYMPFKFDSPEGRMEITVRPGPANGEGESGSQFGAAATFIQHGPRALERVKLSAKASSHQGVMLALTTGFKVNPHAHHEGSIERRVLVALCSAAGVVEIDA
jgi:hypothetical protein